MSAISVLECGAGTSLQDEGRVGYRRYGVAASGAMDPFGLAAANILVGNAIFAPALEFVLSGGVFSVEDAPLPLAVAGAPCQVEVDGKPVPHSSTLILEPQQVLTVGPMREGVFAYLAIGGDLLVEKQLGSVSLHRRAGIGGFQGRPLRAGDRIRIGRRQGGEEKGWTLPAPPLFPQAPLRVVLGPQDDYFAPEAIADFLASDYLVSAHSDRMGYRLTGPAIPHTKGFNIVSDGVVPGSIQVPGSGEPIVMMADHQTTGGYPKIATVILADLRRLAQRRPGSRVRFEAVPMAEAQDLARRYRAEMRDLPRLRQSSDQAAELLSLNLAGDAVNAFAIEP